MEINFTLFVQIVHFYIGYILLKKLFLEPAYHAIKNEEENQFFLHKSIRDTQETIVNKEEQKAQAWQRFVTLFRSYRPDIDRHEPYLLTTQKIKKGIADLDPDRVKSEIDQLGKTVVEQIRREYE